SYSVRSVTQVPFQIRELLTATLQRLINTGEKMNSMWRRNRLRKPHKGLNTLSNVRSLANVRAFLCPYLKGFDACLPASARCTFVRKNDYRPRNSVASIAIFCWKTLVVKNPSNSAFSKFFVIDHQTL